MLHRAGPRHQPGRAVSDLTTTHRTPRDLTAVPGQAYIARYAWEMSEVSELRRRAGMTQDALATASGVAQPNIAAYETGRRRPSRVTLDRLRAAAVPRPSTVLAEHREDIGRLVAKHRGTHPRVFGSVARGIDRAGSDLDLLVRFAPDASLYDLVELKEDLQELLGVGVDVISEGGLHPSQNNILAEAIPL
jgi:predicted nucleotidyltransferase/DNA-binding XRE family transcriptional regulator